MPFTYRFSYPDGKPVARATVTLCITRARREETLFSGVTDAGGAVTIVSDKVPKLATAKCRLTVTDAATGAAIHESALTPLGEFVHDREISVERSTVRPGRPPLSALSSVKAAVPLADTVRARHGGERRLTDAVAAAAEPDLKRRRNNKGAAKRLSIRLLGAKPLTGRADSRLFVPRGTDPASAISAAQRSGLDRLAKQPRTGLRLRGELPITVPQDGTNLTAANVQRVLHGIPAGMVMSSPIQDLLRRCAAEHRAAAATPAPAAAGGTPAPVAATGSPLLSPTIAQRLAALLDKSFSATAPGARPTTSTVASSLATAIPSGPADVAAYYDFRSLQVAWEDVWTAAIDGLTERQIRELYESVVEVVPPTEVDADLSEIDELHDMLDTLENSVSAVNASLATPTELAGWDPAIAVGWADLSFTDQEYLRFLCRADGIVAALRAAYLFAKAITPGSGAAILEDLTSKRLDSLDGFDSYPAEWIPGESLAALVVNKNWAHDIVANVLTAAAKATAVGSSRLGRAERLITGLKKALAAKYQFDVFAPGAHNYGLLITYRQQWLPLTYQAGDLAGAIALAPNERRTYRIERKSTRTDARTASRTRTMGGSSEMTSLSRAEADIASTAQRKLTAGANATASGGLADVWSVTAGSQVSADQGTTSNQTKRDISEATRKASQDYRDEHKVEVRTDESSSVSVEETRELQNPNNELTVTYLFYELQRRYEVSQRLHHAEPVVLVAYEMPAPDKIDEAFVLRYDWIIVRVLLDSSFEAAIRHIRASFAGDEVAVEVLELQWRTQLALVSDLRRQGTAHQALRDTARQAVADAVAAVADAGAGEEYNRGGLGRNFGERLYAAEGVLAEGDSENARQSMDWANLDLAQIESQVREAATALERATEAYVDALRARLNKRTAIDRLLLHLKENIFHYMQAIWRSEPVDQRYLRLYDREIQWPDSDGEAEFRVPAANSSSMLPGPRGLGWPLPFAIPAPLGTLRLPSPRFAGTRKLHEVADLDQLLGFRGNLGIFRLRENNALTLWMAQDFLDTHFGASDPDPLGELPTAEEALAIAECAWHDAALSAAQKTEIAEWLIQALEAAHAVSQEVVVPTGELFIEALPGAHPLLEDFKLRHRAYDAQRAGAQAVSAEIEALRLAMRLEAGDASDPDVDRVVRIEGVPTSVSVDPA